MTKSHGTVYLIALIVGSVLVAALEMFAYLHGIEPTGTMATVWPYAFPVLLVLWVAEDSKAYPAVYRPFEYGFLVYLLWLPYLPYYLWRTRRFLGLLILVGFVVLYCLGPLAQLAIYSAS
jgi:hypothetical protein